MCRYSTMKPPYRTSFVCIGCRHVAQYHSGLHPCPTCGIEMVDAGRDFQSPRKRDNAGWSGVAGNLAAGRTFSSCGCNGPGYRPRTSAQARQDASAARPALRRLPTGKYATEPQHDAGGAT